MKSSWNWHHEAYLALATALAQISGSRYWRYKSRGLNQLKIHMAIERDRMTPELWSSILARDHYQCQIRLPGCTSVATQVDHIIPLFHMGYSIESNLQAACANCNRAKGVRIL